MTGKATFPELLNRLYFTAMGVVPWDEFLAALAARLEANCAGLMVHDPENREYLVAQQVGVSDPAQQEYAAHYGKYDIHFQAAMAGRKLSAGMVQLSQDVISVPKLRGTYYYNEFLRRYDILHQCGVVIADDGSRLSTITFTRPHGADAFASKEQRFLTRLTPHLQAAFALHRFLTYLRLTKLSLQAAFDASPNPSIRAPSRNSSTVSTRRGQRRDTTSTSTTSCTATCALVTAKSLSSMLPAQALAPVWAL